ncbi:MAG: IS5 family transposase [archaeon]
MIGIIRISKTRMKALKRGRLGEKQMELKEFEVVKKVEQLTYPQDWTSYNYAKTKEKTIAQQLLVELADIYAEEHKRVHFGRPSFTLQEKLIAMFIYSFSRFSTRKAIADIELAKKVGLISKTPHFNSISNMFKDDYLMSVLCDLVEITSLPLRMFEEHLSIDSSGFSCSAFERWLNVRTQKTEKKRHWKKANIICGARTQIIAGITISDGFAADSPELVPLVKKASKNFDMKEVSADKAYLSRDNLLAVSKLGAIPYIPFKKNSRQNPRGYKIWQAMYNYFHTNQEEFMKHYHKRSNVETTFSMLKRNFGSKLRMKNWTGQINELLMKCLCHNLTVLVQESFELGLEINLKACAKIHVAQKEN